MKLFAAIDRAIAFVRAEWRHFALLGLLLLFALFLAGLAADACRATREAAAGLGPIHVAPPRVPVGMVEAPATAKAPRAPRERAVAVRPPELDAKTEAKVAERFHLDLAGDARLLGTWTAPPAPAGGEVAVTVDAEGVPAATFVAKPRPFAELGGSWRRAVGVAVTPDGYGLSVGLGKRLGRVGGLELELSADLDVLANGKTQAVARLRGEF